MVAKPNQDFDVGDIKITATPTVHTDPSGVGFKMHTKSGIITYTSDTSLSGEVVESYKGSRVLIMALTTPLGIKLPHHMSPEDAVEILREVQPETALLTHFGLRAVKAGTDSIAKWVEENSGVKTVAAEDGMKVEVREEIRIDKT
jgi:ribonuclease BN (tRNA processing enzyme)